MKQLILALAILPSCARSVAPPVPDVLSLTTEFGKGSAFVVPSDPNFLVIVTARHCVDDRWGNPAAEVRINGILATDIRRHPEADIAVIVLPAGSLSVTPIPLAVTPPVTRDLLTAWGFHYADDADSELTAYVGHTITPAWYESDQYPFIASTSGAYWGTSGGPVLNEQGEVVGVISQSPPGDISIILAVPIRLILTLASEVSNVR